MAKGSRSSVLRLILKDNPDLKSAKAIEARFLQELKKKSKSTKSVVLELKSDGPLPSHVIGLFAGLQKECESIGLDFCIETALSAVIQEFNVLGLQEILPVKEVTA